MLKAEGKELEEAPKKPIEEVHQEEEDQSIFADLDEAEEVTAPQEEAEITVETPEASQELKPEDNSETNGTEVEEVAAEEAPVVPEIDSDIVGTFYLDTSGQDTEV